MPCRNQGSTLLEKIFLYFAHIAITVIKKSVPMVIVRGKEVYLHTTPSEKSCNDLVFNLETLMPIHRYILAGKVFLR